MAPASSKLLLLLDIIPKIKTTLDVILFRAPAELSQTLNLDEMFSGSTTAVSYQCLKV